MSTISPTTVNQAILIHGRRVLETPPLPASSNTRYSREQGCSAQGQWEPTAEALLSAQAKDITFALSRPSSPDRYYSELTKVVATWNLHTSRPSMNPYEEEEPPALRNARMISRAASWQSRVKMFDAAMGTGSAEEAFNGILAISVDPTEPDADQLLYYGFNIVDMPSAATRPIADRSITSSAARADRNNPPPLLQGSFDPHPYFGCSSNLFTPEFGPSYPPDVDAMFPETAEDIAPCTSDIKRVDLRDLVNRIAAAFIADVHARAIVVTVRDQDAAEDLKYKYFLKR